MISIIDLFWNICHLFDDILGLLLKVRFTSRMNVSLSPLWVYIFCKFDGRKVANRFTVKIISLLLSRNLDYFLENTYFIIIDKLLKQHFLDLFSGLLSKIRIIGGIFS